VIGEIVNGELGGSVIGNWGSTDRIWGILGDFGGLAKELGELLGEFGDWGKSIKKIGGVR
jgi:hypothetical protein